MSDRLKTAFGRITGTDAEEVRLGEARNGMIHVVSLTLTKTADALIDPKLVLSWLLTALSAPGAMIGLLVPVREAGALLPQLALARSVEASPQRKRFWAAGSAVQGLAALGIAAAALLLSGAVAGAVIVACLAVLAVARSASSVSYKDSLARTIAKRRRGAITGLAASVASVSVFGVGLLMAAGVFEVAVAPLAALIAVAGAAFLLAAVLFMALREPRERNDDEDDDGSLAALVDPILTDAQLRLFVGSRAALAVTALAPPFIVMLSAASGRTALDQLGPLVMASTAASVLASYVWGRLSDRSSRQTLMAAGALGAVVFAATGALGLVFGGLGGALGAAAAIFAAQIAYEGVRAGRKLHLTDMAEDGFRARYTALSNTLIGLALLAGGLFGLAADRFGPAAVLLAFAVIAALGAVLARGLEEVQQD
ncbi:MFS transporter [Rhodosalinus sp. 5P4]|uniref:MFS transporter n=1 Tax=Rhodosalinus sp. 5P4 TaxID=3239196 RepID=UPI003523FA8F